MKKVTARIGYRPLVLAMMGILSAGNVLAEDESDLRVAELAAAVYPCSGTTFNDVSSNHWACGYIEELMNLNITQGCVQDDPGTPENEAAYCPSATVTRDQMAVFFVRALEETLFDILDGAGNGLDADLLDGQHGDYYRDWNNMTNIPTDIANGDADTLGFLVCGDGEVAKFQDSTLSWVCGTDQVGTGGGGDITGVAAGTGLSGGGSSGDVTLSVQVPLALSGADSGAVITGTNSESTGSPVGVKGIASDAGSATSIGVMGVSASSTGYGIWGDAPFVGVFGQSDTYAVWGSATASGTGTGVTGRGGAMGVDGEGRVYGVKGVATSDTGPSYGLYGEGGAVGYGVWSQGDAHVEGDLTWSAHTSRLSVSPPAFQPENAQIDYQMNGYSLEHIAPIGGNTWYLASVQLPDGAVVTRVDFYWTDGSNADGELTLYRSDFANDTGVVMANASSSGGSSTSNITVTGSSFDDTISQSTIDNSAYSYYLTFAPNTDVANGVGTILRGAVITYTTTQPH